MNYIFDCPGCKSHTLVKHKTGGRKLSVENGKHVVGFVVSLCYVCKACSAVYVITPTQFEYMGQLVGVS